MIREQSPYPIAVTLEGCWIWNGVRNEHGYGLVQIGSRAYYAHRHLYFLAVGGLEDGIVLDHLCRNRACVNPEHLEPVTAKENTIRGIGPTAQNARKTHCVRGHEFTWKNTTFRADGSRRCRACNNSQNARCMTCRHGHQYTEDNIVYRKDGSRQCKICIDSRRAADDNRQEVGVA